MKQLSQTHAAPDAPVRSRFDRRPAAAPAAGAVTVLARTPITGDLLTLTVTRPAGFRYRAGQHVKLGLPGLMRTYSLVSAPHQPELEFFIELYGGGGLSERLRTVRAGDRLVLAERPKGALALDPRFPNQLCITTVTGVAPILSMLRDHRHRAPQMPRRFIVLHGASYAAELGYRPELSGLAAAQPQAFVYLPTVSRPDDPRNAGWTGLRGRVEGHLDEVLARYALTSADTAAFACGHPEMVRNVATELRRRGFTTAIEPFD